MRGEKRGEEWSERESGEGEVVHLSSSFRHLILDIRPFFAI